jgi:four helix bundle protein
MATFHSFEDIEAWSKARILVREIYLVTSQKGFSRDFALKDQIRRAAISIPSNIGEGFERNGSKEFHQFLSMAKGSCGEVRTQLYVALDQKYLSPDEFKRLESMAAEVGRMIGGLMAYLRSTNIKGLKYRKPKTP